VAPGSRPTLPRGRSEHLAYAFFHRPRRTVRRTEYERALAQFHVRLAQTPTEGFRESAALRLATAPWREARPRAVYLDWYVVEGFQSLDPVRAVAYRPPWVRSHRAIARWAADGWGALYSGPRGARPPDLGDRLAWFGSSSLLTVPWGDLRRGGPPMGTLWRRQLALGPSPEFCWVTAGPIPRALERRATVSVPEFIVRPDVIR
jgi:hypothetical protein